MRNFYTNVYRCSFRILPQSSIFRALFKIILLFTITSLLLFVFPASLTAQKLEFSYSYINISRNSGGGTLEQGDTIEVHALVKVNAVTNNFYYVDTIRTGTKYITNSVKLITNEGILFRGPYTDAPLDDNGLYDISGGISRVRVNLGAGTTSPNSGIANFGVTTGGGTVTPGNTPKFYGTTLFIVAYKLLITANFGDTIHLTGNYYLDTAGVKRSYRFNYAGIKIVKNQALCNNFSSASFAADSSFKTGNTQNRVLPAIVPGYIKVNMGLNSPQDNYYAIANNTSANGTTNNAGPYIPTANANRVFNGFWDIIGDHTGATNPVAGNPPTSAGQTGGYMLVVNAAYPTGEAYRDTIKNVCPNTYYEFSAWVRNICGKCSADSNSIQKYTPGVLPNLSYTINDIDYFTTGTLIYNQTWQKRGFIYKTGPAETQFRIAIKNNAAGGGGNDWVLDDIKLATCYPNLIMNPSDTTTSCKGYPVTLSDTVKSYFNNYVNWCWEKSNDGINWFGTGVCGTKVPTLVNGLWVYVVDTMFNAVAADSGKYYRLKVATTYSNLSNSSCAVNNSQKIFLKIYNVKCITLDGRLLSFYGSIMNDKAVLRWVSQNEENLEEYEIEKSNDGINFTKAGIIAASNNINGSAYAFNDPDKISSVVYYRLKLVNQSKNADKYSKIITLYNTNAPFKVSVANPFKNKVTMEVFLPGDGHVNFNLYDLFGRIVSKKSVVLVKGNSPVTLDDVSRLSPGIYILRTYFNNSVFQHKLFKAE
ncbi:MAG: T9SS type A sorting domain-containing protein [Ginsengibacter sp.]